MQANVLLKKFLCERIYTMDNQNNQNEYTNFNGYQAPPTPQQQPVQQPVQPQYAPVQQVPYNPYQATVQTEKKHKSLVLGILSIVIPIISCTYLSPIGLILGLIGVIRNKKSVVSWIGLAISLLACAYLGLVIYFLVDPDRCRTLLQSSGMYSDAQIDEMLRTLYGFIVPMF